MMKVKKLGVIAKGQDGAIYNGYLFRFTADGGCSVYETQDLSAPMAHFVLDKAQNLAPHSNSVAFGSARYRETDEFPLLYSNIYNNYAKTENPRKGVTCVYRLVREGKRFSTTLVQLLEVGFTEDPIWRSAKGDDVRPYGNFAIDSQKGQYYAFVMRDEDRVTRYFAFDLLDPRDGVPDPALGVNRVVLGKKDIRATFDCPYQRFVQGACFRKGRIYSLEGFTEDPVNPPAVRIVDTQRQTQEAVHYFGDFGLTIEPELIDFDGEICYYADHDGNLYGLRF